MAETQFWGAVQRITTLADGGIRVTFDMGEDAIVQAAELMTYKREGVVLDVTCTPRVEEENEPDKQRTDRKLHI